MWRYFNFTTVVRWTLALLLIYGIVVDSNVKSFQWFLWLIVTLGLLLPTIIACVLLWIEIKRVGWQLTMQKPGRVIAVLLLIALLIITTLLFFRQ